MPRALQLARRAQRRRALQGAIAALGPSLAVASGAALIVILTDRLIGPGIETWWQWMLIPALGAGLLTGVAIGFFRRGSELSAASQVDTALALKDRIASALWFATAQRDDPFALLAREEGERAADSINLSRALPLRFGRSWRLWPVLLAGAICAGLFLPALRLLDAPGPAALTPEQIAAQQEVTRVIDEALQQVPDPAQAEPGETPVADLAATRGTRDLLEAIRKELESGNASPDEAIARAAGALDQLAGQSRAAAESLQSQSDASKAALRSIPSADEMGAPGASANELTPSGADLTDALREGDFQAAESALEELREQIAALPTDDREETADDLESLAEALSNAAQAAEQRAQDAAEQEARRLQEQGLAEEDAAELSRNAQKQDELERALRERGLDPETARRLAERLAEQRRQRDAQNQAAEDARRLAEAARQAAEDVRDPTPPTPPAPPTPPKAQDNPESSQQNDPEQSTSEKHPDPSQQSEGQTDGQTKPGDAQPSDQQKQQNGDPQNKDPNAQNAPQHSDAPTPGQQGEQQQQQQQQQQPGSTPDGAQPDPNAPPQGQSEQGQPTPDGRDPSQQPQQQQQPGAEPDPSGKPAQSPNQNPQGEGQPEQQPGAPDPSNPASPEQQAEGQSPDAGAEQQRQPQQGPNQQPQQGQEPGDGIEPPELTPPDLSPRGLEAMKEALKRMQEREEQAQRESERSREMERKAREMYEKMSPEERERLQRWAAENMREGGADKPQNQNTPSDNEPGGGQVPRNLPGQPSPGTQSQNSDPDSRPGSSKQPIGTAPPRADGDRPTKTAPVDIRRAGENPRVAGQWTRPDDPNNPAARADGAISTREMEDLLREAQESANQAVEDQLIPARYRNVAEYFRKARERAEKAKDAEQTPPAPPAPDAKDVETKKP